MSRVSVVSSRPPVRRRDKSPCDPYILDFSLSPCSSLLFHPMPASCSHMRLESLDCPLCGALHRCPFLSNLRSYRVLSVSIYHLAALSQVRDFGDLTLVVSLILVLLPIAHLRVSSRTCLGSITSFYIPLLLNSCVDHSSSSQYHVHFFIPY